MNVWMAPISLNEVLIKAVFSLELIMAVTKGVRDDFDI